MGDEPSPFSNDGSPMNAAVKFVPALGRFLLALIFVLSGISKLGALGATSAHMVSQGIPYPNILIWGAIVLELGGGVMLIAGIYTRCVAFALCFYTMALAIIFHAYWTMSGAAARTEHAAFFEHLSMMGGMLYVFMYGAGAYSVDAWLGLANLQPSPARLSDSAEGAPTGK
jgi:putative oxidoreductase